MSISNSIIIIREYETLDFSLYEARINKVLETYRGLFNEELIWFSQLIKGGKIHGNKGKDELHVHFIKSNVVYSISSINQIISNGNILREIRDIPEETTHLIILDIFCRIRKIIPIKSSSSLLAGIYGDDPLLKIGQLNTDNPIFDIILPLGNINRCGDHFQFDQLGIRYILEERNLNALKNDSNINIGVVGGSFAASVYSLPGESFSEHLEKQLNNNHKKFKFWNLSQGGHVQSDNLSYLINTGAIKTLDHVIWIDGLNDLSQTIPSKTIGLEELPFSISTCSLSKTLFSIDKEIVNSIKTVDRVDSFLKYRRLAVDILEAVGVNCINVLQPICDRKALNHSTVTSSLLNYSDRSNWRKHYIEYQNVIPYIKSLGFNKYGLKFEIPKTQDIPLAFNDMAHLSPIGEEQFAKIIAEYINNLVRS